MPKLTHKQKLIFYSYLVGWFLASVIWQLLRNIDFKGGFQYFHFELFLIMWLFMGVFYGLLHVILNKYLNKRMRYLPLLFTSLTLQIVVTFVIVLLMYPTIRYGIGVYSEPFSEFLKLPAIPVSLIFALIINFLISVSIQINFILGEGTLVKLIKGKFYTPKIEKRIFMFLDLKGSTTIAEKMDNLKYTEFIQDCFFDLAVINKNYAEVYKYVGDEAILVWEVDKGLKEMNCVEAFFAFKKRLHENTEDYKKKYGTIPFFKAGLHIGDVTIAEIGELKKEIAYLGDTVNTAARIQGECNRLETDFLISKNLLDLLNIEAGIEIESKGNILLKGKKEEVNIFSLVNKR